MTDPLRPPDTDDEPWPVYDDRPRPAVALVMVAVLAGFVLMAAAALVAAVSRIVGWLR